MLVWSKKEKVERELMDTENCGDCQKGWGGEWRRVQRGQMVEDRRLRVMNTQCTDDVLWNCAPEICIIPLTSVTPINSIKRKNTFIPGNKMLFSDS